MTKSGANHQTQLSRLSRIEGQVRGIARMIEEEKYCIDILTQFRAVRSALKSLELKVLETHLQHCVGDAIESGSKKKTDKKIEEIMTLLQKVSK